MENYLTSAGSIEELTGIDFLTTFDHSVQEDVEDEIQTVTL